MYNTWWREKQGGGCDDKDKSKKDKVIMKTTNQKAAFGVEEGLRLERTNQNAAFGPIGLEGKARRWM